MATDSTTSSYHNTEEKKDGYGSHDNNMILQLNDMEVIKKKGNSLFVKGNYQNALKEYKKVIALLAEKDNGNQNKEDNGKHASYQYLNAVCVSNISNCYFEMGRYDSCLKYAEESMNVCGNILSSLSESPSMRDQVEVLQCKNLLRMARAHFYMGYFKDDVSTKPLQEIISRGDATTNNKQISPFIKRAQRMLQQISHYNTNSTPTNTDAKEIWSFPVSLLLRPAIMNPTVEYYKFGHDTVASALDSNEGDDDVLKLDAVPDLSILFAGINDGRHVFYTAMHIFEQYEDLSKEKQDKVHVKLMCNDVCVATVARFVIYCIILHKIGTLAPKFSDIQDNPNGIASRWCTVLQYIFLGYAMPSWVNQMLIDVMEEIIQCNTTYESFHARYPWLPCTFKADWDALQPVLSYWIDQASTSTSSSVLDEDNDDDNENPSSRCSSLKDYDKKKQRKNYNLHDSNWENIPPVGESLDCFQMYEASQSEAYFEGLEDNARNNMEKQRQENRIAEKTAFKEKVMDLTNWSPDFKETMRTNSGLPPDTPDEEIRDFFLRAIENAPLEDFDRQDKKDTFTKIPSIALAFDFVRQTKAILPPRGQCCDSDDDEFSSIFKNIYHKQSDTKENYKKPKQKDRLSSASTKKVDQNDIRQAERIIKQTWCTNPLMFDPLHHSTGGGKGHSFDPITQFLNDFHVVEYCTTPFDYSDIDSAEKMEFYNWTSCFFWNAAHALVTLCGCCCEQQKQTHKQVLVIEWNVGDIISTCSKLRNREKEAAAVGSASEMNNKTTSPTTASSTACRFHRIHASNIPDYTGILGFFTEVMPLLYDSTPDVTTRLDINLLANCPLWDSYAHYIYSSTAIFGIKDVEHILGMKYFGEPDATTWEHYYCWTQLGSINDDGSRNQNGLVVTKDELTLWLQRLFLHIALPPERDYTSRLREYCPNTMALFVRVCVFCVENLGYPSHWVSCVLDELLNATTVTSNTNSRRQVSGSSCKTLKTHAKVLTTSPSNYQEENCSGGKTDRNDINVSSFSLDLSTQLALEVQKQQQEILYGTRKTEQSLRPLELLRLPNGPIYEYQITFPANLNLLDLTNTMANGFPNVNCLGLVLEPTDPEPSDHKDKDSGDDDDDYISMMFKQMTEKLMKMKPKTGIRKDVLAKGGKSFQVLSCMKWELIDFGDSNRAIFQMSTEDFQFYKHYYISILRTDGWFRLGNAVRLREATRIASA